MSQSMCMANQEEMRAELMVVNGIVTEIRC